MTTSPNSRGRYYILEESKGSQSFVGLSTYVFPGQPVVHSDQNVWHTYKEACDVARNLGKTFPNKAFHVCKVLTGFCKQTEYKPANLLKPGETQRYDKLSRALEPGTDTPLTKTQLSNP